MVKNLPHCPGPYGRKPQYLLFYLLSHNGLDQWNLIPSSPTLASGFHPFPLTPLLFTITIVRLVAWSQTLDSIVNHSNSRESRETDNVLNNIATDEF